MSVSRDVSYRLSAISSFSRDDREQEKAFR